MSHVQALARTVLQLECIIIGIQRAIAGLKEQFTDEDWSFYTDVHEASLHPQPRIDDVYVEAANRHK